MTGPRHLQRAQRQHLASQICPPLLLPLGGHLAAQMQSFLFIQIQLLLRSAALESDLTACWKACPLTPIPLSSLVVDVATKPLQPTSTGSTWAHHPRCLASAVKSEYFSRFRSYASLTAPSQGTVNSTMKTDFCEVDHKTRSGLRLVVAISGGKISLWSKSTSILQSRALSKRVDGSTFAAGLVGSCPARRNVLVGLHPGTDGGRAFVLVLLPSREMASCRKTWLCLQV